MSMMHYEEQSEYYKEATNVLRAAGLSEEDVEKIKSVGIELAKKVKPPPDISRLISLRDNINYKDYKEIGGVFCRIGDRLEFIEEKNSKVSGVGIDILNSIKECWDRGGSPVTSIHTHPLGDIVPSNIDHMSSANVGFPFFCIATALDNEKSSTHEERTLAVKCYLTQGDIAYPKEWISEKYNHIDIPVKLKVGDAEATEKFRVVAREDIKDYIEEAETVRGEMPVLEYIKKVRIYGKT